MNPVKLWLLKPADGLGDSAETNPWVPWYDKAHGYVIRALTEKEARTMAANDSGEAMKRAWLEPKLSKCEPLAGAGEAEIVLMDYRSA